MADNSNNILNQLQQHSMQPPAGAFSKAWGAIVQSEKNDNENVAERKIFSQLQEHAIAAPAFDFNTIAGAAPKIRRLVIPSTWLRAASVILILTIAGILYFTVFSKKEKAADNYAGAPATPDTATQTITGNIVDTANQKIAATAPTVAANPPIAAEVLPKKIIISNRYVKSGTLKTNNYSEGQLYENDVLLTLVNYKSRDWQQFFTKAVADKKITLNKYSYHNLSDKMVEMLQDMYLVKNNGKPTRRAKKTKKKFEKWRKKDEKYFDKDLQKNPADIIDLSEFILKNN